MKTAACFAFLLATTSIHATDLKPCGSSGDFKSGKEECAKVNGADAETNGWHLVKREGDKSWWQDSETETVWSPTHSYYLNGKREDGAVAFTFEAAEKGCLSEGASLPTLEEYYYAFTWRYALTVMNNSVESILGTKPVFWATSSTFKSKAWWVAFKETGNLEGIPFTPLSKTGYPGDYRCVWRK